MPTEPASLAICSKSPIRASHAIAAGSSEAAITKSPTISSLAAITAIQTGRCRAETCPAVAAVATAG